MTTCIKYHIYICNVLIMIARRMKEKIDSNSNPVSSHSTKKKKKVGLRYTPRHISTFSNLITSKLPTPLHQP